MVLLAVTLKKWSRVRRGWGLVGSTPQKTSSPNPARFFLKSLRTSDVYIRGAIVYTLAWRTAVNDVVVEG